MPTSIRSIRHDRCEILVDRSHAAGGPQATSLRRDEAQSRGTSEATETTGTRDAAQSRVAGEAAVPRVVRLLSPRSQTVLEEISILNGWVVPPASSVWLLLRVAAGRHQSLLSDDQCKQMHQQIEDCKFDVVRELLDGLGIHLEPHMPAEAPWECAICFSDQDQQGWRCPYGHRYCSTCMGYHADSVAFPRCPAEKCTYQLAEADLRVLHVSTVRLDAFLNAQLQRAIDELSSVQPVAGVVEIGRETLESGPQAPEQATGTNRASASEVAVRCSNTNCGNLILLDRRARRCRFACSCGATPFCTRCRAEPYHYHGHCEHQQALRERWLHWLERDRLHFHETSRQADDYDERVAAMRAAMARHAELEQDELWKEAHCRLCPICRRPIEKTEGCDQMVCGQNAHGGNVQPGCGCSFKWSEAAPYKNESQSQPLPEMSVDEIRCRGKATLHAFMNCDLCGSSDGRGIIGPRFRCLHCPDFNVCLGCEPQLASAHAQGHVFEVLFEAEFVWSSLQLPLDTAVRTIRHCENLPWGMDGETRESREAIAAIASGGRDPAAPEQAIVPPLGVGLASAALLPEGLVGKILEVTQPPPRDRQHVRRRRRAWGYRVKFEPSDPTMAEMEVRVPAVHLEPVLTSNSAAEELIQKALRTQAEEMRLESASKAASKATERAAAGDSERLQAWRRALRDD